MMKKLTILFFVFLLIPFVSAELYDDFESGELDTNLWEVRQDTEGQPLMNEYGIRQEDGNYVFHTNQNETANRRVYLFPKRNFTTGDSIEYDTNLVSKEGHYGNMILLTGDQYIRIGIFGYNNGVQGYDELGSSHIKMSFEENELKLRRESPSGQVLLDTLQLNNPNGNYELYIGSFSGHNGIVHMDFDNFEFNRFFFNNFTINLNDFEERISALEEQVEELNERATLLESLYNGLQESLNNFMNETVNYLTFLSKSAKKGGMICKYMKENNLNNYTSLGLQCEITRLNRCRCEEV